MWEPRGHADMYGGWIGPPLREDSDLSVLFLHNEGFSTMCGHGIIALAEAINKTGFIEMSETKKTIRIDTPAGQVTATPEAPDGQAAFLNVPSFAADLDSVVSVPGLGRIAYDLAFGGAFYAYVDARQAGVDLDNLSKLIDWGRRIKSAVSSSRSIVHPTDPDLGFLYGVIFVGPPSEGTNHHRSVCVFADGEIDRSPTGTGVSGSLAIHHERGEMRRGDSISVESLTGSVFGGRIESETSVGTIGAVIPEISGRAHLTGRAELWVDPGDPLGEGFFIR